MVKVGIAQNLSEHSMPLNLTQGCIVARSSIAVDDNWMHPPVPIKFPCFQADRQILLPHQGERYAA